MSTRAALDAQGLERRVKPRQFCRAFCSPVSSCACCCCSAPRAIAATSARSCRGRLLRRKTRSRNSTQRRALPNYPPGYLFILWIVGKIYLIVPHALGDYSLLHNLVELPACAFDLVNAVLIAWIVRRLGLGDMGQYRSRNLSLQSRDDLCLGVLGASRRGTGGIHAVRRCAAIVRKR